MPKRTVSIKHFDIFDYWKDKCITDEGNIEIEMGYEGYDETKSNIHNSIPIVEDWGEPQCFACGVWTGIKPEKDDIDCNGDVNLKNIWGRVKGDLQRAHIIPAALGGEDVPSNLFCLCGRCHRDSPDTIYANEFFRWVYLRRKEGTLSQRTINQAVNECKRRNINPAFIQPNSTFNETFEILGSHGGLTVESSFVASLVGKASNLQKAVDQLLCAKKSKEILDAAQAISKCTGVDLSGVVSQLEE